MNSYISSVFTIEDYVNFPIQDCSAALCFSAHHLHTRGYPYLPHRWKLVYLKVGLIWTICLFSTCAAKDLRCVVNRFRRTGPVPSSDKLKRLSRESKSARDFRRPGFKSTSPFNSMKRTADELLSTTNTTPLVKHRPAHP